MNALLCADGGREHSSAPAPLSLVVNKVESPPPRKASPEMSHNESCSPKSVDRPACQVPVPPAAASKLAWLNPRNALRREDVWGGGAPQDWRGTSLIVVEAKICPRANEEDEDISWTAVADAVLQPQEEDASDGDEGAMTDLESRGEVGNSDDEDEEAEAERTPKNKAAIELMMKRHKCPYCSRQCQKSGPWGLRNHLAKDRNHMQGCPKRPLNFELPPSPNSDTSIDERSPEPTAEGGRVSSSNTDAPKKVGARSSQCPYCFRQCTKKSGPWSLASHLRHPKKHHMGCKARPLDLIIGDRQQVNAADLPPLSAPKKVGARSSKYQERRSKRQRDGTQRDSDDDMPSRPLSKYRGVTWIRASQRWQARINHKGNQIHIGTFQTEAEAGRAYRLLSLLHSEKIQQNNKTQHNKNASFF